MAEPRYKLLQPIYVDDVYIEEDTEIEYDGAPNLAMLPLNKEAKEAYDAFVETLEDASSTLDEIVFREMTARPRHLRAPRDKLVIPTDDAEPPMTGLNNTGEIQRMAIEKPKAVKSAAPSKAARPKKVFGGGVTEASA